MLVILKVFMFEQKNPEAWTAFFVHRQVKRFGLLHEIIR